MKILHVLYSYSIVYGGPPKIASQIAEGIKHKCEIDILISYSPGEKLVGVPDGVNLFSFKRSWFHRFWKSHSPGMRKFLKEHIHEYDLVHIHEVWSYHLYAAGRTAISKKIPFIVTTHGELDEWALAYKGLKKKIFSLFFQQRLLRKAAAIHVGTQKEALEVNKYLRNSVPALYEIPNALLNESFQLEANSTPLDFDYNTPYILFLSRINIKKGCDILIDAYAQWQHRRKYKLVLAGPYEPVAYAEDLKSLASSLGEADNIMFVGSVHGETKKKLLQNAALFALTSYAEGFPVAILEALQAGCPLLLSNKCGFDKFLQNQKVALVCDTNAGSVLNRLEDFEKLSQTEIEEIRRKGPTLIKDYYSSEKVSEKFIEMYSDVLTKTKKH